MNNSKHQVILTSSNDVWGGWEANVDYEVSAGDGDDTLYGYDGDDTLDGGDGDDVIYGGKGKDKIKGGNGKDKLFGGDGDDEIDGGDGDDEIFGGNGNDKIKGGNGKDKLFGGDGDDEIDGGDGDDEIFGEGGKNKLRGGSGRDRIHGGNGIDNISGGLGNDTIFGNGGDDFIQGDEDSDTIFGGTGNDVLEGNSGNDIIFGEDDQDFISGNEGDDYLNGGAGDDTVDGGAGNDYLYGYLGEDILNGGDGDDVLDGGDGNDSLVGGGGNDTLSGEAGNDILTGVSSDGSSGYGLNTIDTLVGGTGHDVFVLGDVERAFYDDGNVTTNGSSDYVLIKDFHRLEDSIQLNGSASDYVVAGLTGDLALNYSGMSVAGIYQDTNSSGTWDNADELLAIVEHIAPQTLVLEGGYFQYTSELETATDTLWHPSNDENWELVFSDEFSLASLDYEKWNTRYSSQFYEGRTNLWNAEHQAYVGDGEVIDGVEYDAFDFNDGVLSIVSQKVDTPLTLEIGSELDGFDSVKTFEYTSGILTSEDNYAFTYGYMEIGAQVAAGQGLWPAFWMLPANGGWPPEIDVMEALGHQTHTTYNSFHYIDESGNVASEKGQQTFSNVDFSAGFHTYGVEWSADELTWFVDGQAMLTVDHDIPDVSMYLLANMAVGGYWPGSPDETTPETSAFEIDFIRVYQNDKGTLHGGSKDDVLTKSLGNLAGEGGDDTLIGGDGDNHLFGGSGNDTLIAGVGADILMGTDESNAGQGEIDILTGGLGADIFVLGSDGQRFYDDGDLITDGRLDYAFITDFDLAQDIAQLVGNIFDYRLGSASNGFSTELWHTASSTTDELIAVFDQLTINTFDQGFSFAA